MVKAERFMQYGVFEPKQIQPKKLINTPYLKQYLNIRLGERLDKPTDTSISSMMKEVYVVEREPDKVIAILKDASEIVRLNQELELLTELENMGIDVVEVIGRTKHHGKDAIIMKRYSKSSKSILDLVDNKLKIVGPYEANSLNINSLRSLQKIQAKLLENAIAISDLQFLIEADGTFVLNDPLGVLHKNKPRYTDYAKENFKIIDTFI
ncbi:MAG: hypothetical protein IT236_07850, partial [Bacteroidia bacterium]|nr:hypothetical protein [Bacteroidia bacterium]